MEKAGDGEQGAKAAYDAMETTRTRFPKDPRTWTTQAEMLIRQGKSDERKYDKAEAALDRAGQQLGDRVELRLARMQLASIRGRAPGRAGPDQAGARAWRPLAGGPPAVADDAGRRAGRAAGRQGRR